MKKGKFVIISGPSGVGKDTICDELVKKGMGRYSVSMTTRKKRSNEIEGISYFFVSKEEFKRHIEEDYFLQRCGKRIPIIIQDLEFTWYVLEATKKVNIHDEAHDFFKALESGNM